MAIAALSVHGAGGSVSRARALGVAGRFAAGHALLLSGGAATIVLAGWSIPAAFERGGEILGGALLIGMGGVTLAGLLSGRLYGHSHRHGREPQPHWHLHVGRPDRHPAAGVHSHVPTMVGAAFAVSSLRALAMLTPFGAGLESTSLLLLLGLIAVFAVGILLAMALFGVALSRVLSTAALERLGEGAGALVGLASILLGAAWIATA